ncbi:MAG TPA: helix-turn-helix domain-containing protein [Burkholderiales bacterium]|nr:helix-turn-helix domain-containing protein [Burkholderiales bacterium]
MTESIESPRPDSAGAALHAERRRQNMSLGDVSRQLKISVRQVEALERDDFQPFGGPVFVHGFLRNYAKLLGLDAEPLLRAADTKLVPPPAAVEEAHASAPVPVRDISHRGMTIAAVIVVAIGVVAVGAMRAASRKPEATQPAAIAVAPPQTPASAPPAVVKEAEPPSPAAMAAPAEQDVSPSPSGNLATLRMVFDQESWVEVKDRSGSTIFGQLSPAGSRRKISGEPPLSVVIGNAAGVHLTYNDKEIDLAPHTRVDVARLTLE